MEQLLDQHLAAVRKKKWEQQQEGALEASEAARTREAAKETVYIFEKSEFPDRMDRTKLDQYREASAALPKANAHDRNLLVIMSAQVTDNIYRIFDTIANAATSKPGPHHLKLQNKYKDELKSQISTLYYWRVRGLGI